MLLRVLPSCFLTRPKGLRRQTFLLVCSRDFSLVQRWWGRGSSTHFSTQVIQTAEEGNIQTGLSCGGKQNPSMLKGATVRCISSWNLPSGCSHWESPLNTAAVHPSLLRCCQNEQRGTCLHQLWQELFPVESKGTIFTSARFRIPFEHFFIQAKLFNRRWGCNFDWMPVPHS